MKKVFVVNGSSNSDSVTQRIINNFLMDLKGKIKGIRVSSYRINNKINFCQGCGLCFQGKRCSLDRKDEMRDIKNEMLESDIVIFATPTYFKCVSAQMKLFLDRITYMSHLYSCIGKTGIIIVTGSYNGVEETVQYLADFMIRLGLVNIKIIKYKRMSDTYEYIKNNIDKICKEISEYYSGKRKINISKESENIFYNTQLYYKIIPNCFEKRYWEKSKLLEADSLESYIVTYLTDK